MAALGLAQRAGLQREEAFAFQSVAYMAEDAGVKAPARRLMALCELVAAQSAPNPLANALEQHPTVSSSELETLRKQAADAYKQDRGWSVVREAFPNAAPPAP